MKESPSRAPRWPRRRGLRALLLAAGRGERLRPLSLEIPKPLLPVAGRPLAAASLDALVEAGCEAIAVNLHHLGEPIAAALGTSWRGVTLHYSRETELLGTLGALGPLRELFAGASEILIVNGDSLCRWPLRRLLDRHRRSGALATLLLARRAPAAEFGGGVRCAADGRVLGFGRGTLTESAVRAGRVFAGAHVLAPALLDRLPAGRADTITDLYEPLLAEGASLQTLSTSRPWHDLGTPRRYLEGALAWALSPLPPGACWLAPGVERGAGARLAGSVVEAGARRGPAGRVRRRGGEPGCEIGAGASLVRVIVGPGVAVPAGASHSDALLTRGTMSGHLQATPL